MLDRSRPEEGGEELNKREWWVRDIFSNKRPKSPIEKAIREIKYMGFAQKIK